MLLPSDGQKMRIRTDVVLVVAVSRGGWSYILGDFCWMGLDGLCIARFNHTHIFSCHEIIHISKVHEKWFFQLKVR